MKIHAYKVVDQQDSIPLVETLQKISCVDINKRNREHDGSWIRMEEVVKRNDVWLCDFVKIRMDHGPGKGGLNQAVKGFPLADEEGFCEETAFLYHPKSSSVIAQYNHYGPRISSITEYLSLFDHNATASYQFNPKYTDDIQRRISNKTLFRKMELSIVPRLLNQSDFKHGVPLQSALDISNSTGADKVSIIVSVEGKKSTLNGKMMGLIRWAMLKANGQDHAAIDSCKLTAKDDLQTRAEVLDLVAERLMREVKIKPGVDKRIPRYERWSALQRSWDLWKKQLS